MKLEAGGEKGDVDTLNGGFAVGIVMIWNNDVLDTGVETSMAEAFKACRETEARARVVQS